MKEEWPYGDMLDLPHHVSDRHPQMSRAQRAAQFASFDALAGYKSAIKEQGRRTEELAELTEDEIRKLDERLQWIEAKLPDTQLLQITYFVPDEKKTGGAYHRVEDRIVKIDRSGMRIVTEEHGSIGMQQLMSIEDC